MTPIDVEIEKLVEKHVQRYRTLGSIRNIGDSMRDFSAELIPLIREECANIAEQDTGNSWTRDRIAAAIREGK